MAARICPQCMKPVPVTCAAAFTNGMNCPHCNTRLEVGSLSRGVSSFAGLAAAWGVWVATRNMQGILGAIAPVLYAILAFGVVSALVTMLTADLRVAPPAVEPVAAASHGHGGGHH